LRPVFNVTLRTNRTDQSKTFGFVKSHDAAIGKSALALDETDAENKGGGDVSRGLLIEEINATVLGDACVRRSPKKGRIRSFRQLRTNRDATGRSVSPFV
jgi:hypothetical protein